MWLAVSPFVEAAYYGGVDFPSGVLSFADRVVLYEPDFGDGLLPDIVQQDARQILGVPEQGEMSLGNGGRITVQFMDNSLTGSDDTNKDLWVFEVGGPEYTLIEISKDGVVWHPVGMVTGFAGGIDIDQFGFGKVDAFPFVRITDDGDSPEPSLTPGADLVAVGASSSGPPVITPPPIVYEVQAHVGGRSHLIIKENTLQWHHFEGPAPGLCRALWNFGTDANSPTIVDSNQGPNITWVPTGWPAALGNGTHPESFSSIFNALTPFFRNGGEYWGLNQLWGKGDTKIIQQPDAFNEHTLIIEFDDLKGGNVSMLFGSTFYAIELMQLEAELAIEIDIKPGSYPNSINLKSKGKIPVAILTTDDFDAYDVDPDTVYFAGASPLRWKLEDVDKDGDYDMLFHFKTRKLDLTKESAEATLEGETHDGIQITGTDSVNIVPKGKGFFEKGKKGE
jgi:hypothetical protein